MRWTEGMAVVRRLLPRAGAPVPVMTCASPLPLIEDVFEPFIIGWLNSALPLLTRTPAVKSDFCWIIWRGAPLFRPPDPSSERKT